MSQTPATTTPPVSHRTHLNAAALHAIIAASLRGLVFGLDNSITAGVNAELRQYFHLGEWWVGIVNSAAGWAAITGALASGILADRLGRRAAIQIVAVAFLVSAIGDALAWNVWALMLFRMFAGFGVGASAVLCPMYIAEISPAAIRGRVVGAFQFNIVVGILLAFLSNSIVAKFQLGAMEWRFKFAAVAVPNLIFLLGLLGIPQSPRWLTKQKREAEAMQVLKRLGEENPEARLREIHATLSGHSNEPVFQARFFKPLMLGFLLGFFNCFAGINAVLNYLNDLFKNGGLTTSAGNSSAVTVALTNVIFTVVALAVIDKIGRKTLLMIGAILLSASLAAIAAVFHWPQYLPWLQYIVLAYIASFAISQGAVIWVYLSEIVPNSIRGKGEALSGFFAMGLGALITLLVPPVISEFGYPKMCLCFAAVTFSSFFVFWFYFPETQGATLEAMQRRLGITNS